MPSVELSYTSVALQQEGPWILTTISVPQFELDEGRAVGLEYPQLEVRALIDTGASVTVINPEIAQTCKLRHTGFAQISAAGSSGRYPEYAAAVHFANAQLRSFDPIRVVACKLFRQPVSCLLGRDILRCWIMRYDGRNSRIEITESLARIRVWARR